MALTNADKRQRILGAVEACAGGLMYYDRKEDQDLPRGAIEQAVKDAVITVDEIVAAFLEETGLGEL